MQLNVFAPVIATRSIPMPPSSISRRRFLQLTGTTTVAASAGRVPFGGSSADPAPNIVLLFVDDLGYGDLGCYGHPRIRTPNLDRLASEGVQLTSLYSSPTCVPSRFQVLTGRHLARSSIETMEANGRDGLPQEEYTLPEALGEQGYRTKIVGKWHLGHVKSTFLPIHHGFDSWFGLPYSNDGRRPWVKTDTPLRLYRDGEPVERVEGRAPLTPRYTEEATNFLRTGEAPFFLYLAYNMPHLPLQVGEQFRGQSEAGLYGDVVEMLDWSVGRILDVLDREDRAQNTIVIFASDNGPWLDLPRRMLRGGVEPWHVGSPGPFRGGKATTQEGGVRVPGLIRWPGEVPAGRQASGMVGLQDFYPTLLSAAGGTVPEDRPIDGQNVLAFLRGEASSPRTTLYYFGVRTLRAVRNGPWKFRWAPRRIGRRRELFHLYRDLGERHNLVQVHPERADRMEKQLRAFSEEVEASR